MQKISMMLSIVFTTCLSRIATDIYLPALPTIGQQLNTNGDIIQLSVAAAFIGAMLVSPIAGLAADNFGKKPVLMLAVIVFILGNITCTFSQNVWWFVAGRLLLGFGTGAMTTLAHASIQDNFSAIESSKIRAIIATFMYILIGLAPLAGAYLLLFGWRHIFVALAVLGTAFLIHLYVKFKNSTYFSSDTPPLNKKDVNKNYKKLLSNHKYLSAAILYPILMGTSCCYFAIIPYYFINVLHTSPQEFAFYQATINIISALGGIISYFAVAHYPLNRINEWGIKMACVGSLIVLLCHFFADTNKQMIASGLVLFGTGAAIIYAPSITLALKYFPQQRSFASGMRNFFRVGLASLGCIMSSVFDDYSILPFALYMVINSCIGLWVIMRTNRAPSAT